MEDSKNPAPPDAAGSSPQGPATPRDEAAENPWRLDARLLGLCFVLWVVAALIFWSNWPETQKNYYWGNVKQALDTPPGRLDQESIAALVAMGESVIPSCQYELSHHWDPAFRCAVLKVLEAVPGPNAHQAIETLLRGGAMDPDPRVRANAYLTLRARAVRWPDEKKALIAAAEQGISPAGEPELAARAICGIILAESGDRRDVVTALVVYALRLPQLRGDASAALGVAAPDAPRFRLDAPPSEAVSQLMACEKWCVDHSIALVASPLTAPVRSDAVAAPSSQGR